MANYKDTLRQETDFLRGLGSLDEELRNNWLRNNYATLKNARDRLSTDDYRMFAENLYKVLLWLSLDPDRDKVNPSDFSMDYVDNFLNKKIRDIDYTLKYAPDYDENGRLSENNTGWSPENWAIYSKLDEQGKQEFRDRVKTPQEMEKSIKRKTNWNKIVDVSEALSIGVVAGFAPGLSAINGDLARKKAEQDANKENLEAALEIWSKSLQRMINSDAYLKQYLKTLQSLNDLWNKENAENKIVGELQHNYLFLEAAKDNPVLAAASGNDLTSMGRDEDGKTFDQYENLMQNQPEFKALYIAHKAMLEQMAANGEISIDDAKKSLLDIALNALKDNESIWKKFGNALSGISTTAITYELHKYAAAFNTIRAATMSDSEVYLGADGKVYSDALITGNAKFADNNKLDSGVLYRTSDGAIINFKKDGNKIKSTLFGDFIYQSDSGEFFDLNNRSEESVLESYRAGDNHIKKVDTMNVGLTKVGALDLLRMGKNGDGEDVAGWLNERYLSLAERYNTAPWNREELDYYDKYGYSKYNNIVRPGDDGRDFLMEVTRMTGFILADMAEAALLRGAGKLLGASAKGLNGLSMAAGLGGAAGIADSYAQLNFDDILMTNKEALQNHLLDKAQKSAEDFLLTPEGAKMFSDVYNAKLLQMEQAGYKLTPAEEALLRISARNEVLDYKTQQGYVDLMHSPETIRLQNESIDAAGTAAIVDFMGEGLKYAAVNLAGFRKWMFTGRDAAKLAALANERTLFGKTFSRLGVATAEDVQKGLATKEGEVFLKDAWSNMTKKQKAISVLGTTGRQFWGGAWTNWTDEMQSAGAKELAAGLFNAYLGLDNPNGLYLLANALTSQVYGMKQSVFETNSLWAGLVGGVGSVVGVGVNPMGVLEPILTKPKDKTMKQHLSDYYRDNFSSPLEAANSIFSNSVLSEVFQNKANDKYAQDLIGRANRLQESLGDNVLNIVNVLNTASRIGHSENPVEQEELTISHLFNTLQLVNSMNESNPGLMEFDGYKKIQEFLSAAHELTHVGDLTLERKDLYIDLIKIANPTYTQLDAEEELKNVQDRASVAVNFINDWQDLINSDEYRLVAEKGELKSPAQERMEQQLLLRAMQLLTKDNMKDRESRISGRSEISDSIDEVETYGNLRSAPKVILESYSYLENSLQSSLDLIKNKKEALNFDELIEGAKLALLNATTPTEKENAANALLAILLDRDNYDYTIEKLELRIADVREDRARLEEKVANGIDYNKVYTADLILSMDPISRLRMLDPNNRGNYSKRLVEQILKAEAQLANNGSSLDEVATQAYALSRYNQREEMLQDMARGALTNLSFRTRIQNMIDLAKSILMEAAKLHVIQVLRDVNRAAVDNLTAIVLKKDALKLLNSAFLSYLRPHVSNADKALIDEIMPVMKAEQQLADIIYDSNYGLGDLMDAEKENIALAVKTAVRKSSTPQELIEELALNTNSSMSDLLDKFKRVYQQLYSTVIESARERADRLLALRALLLAANQAAANALQNAGNAPSVTTPAASGTSSTTSATPTTVTTAPSTTNPPAPQGTAPTTSSNTDIAPPVLTPDQYAEKTNDDHFSWDTLEDINRRIEREWRAFLDYKAGNASKEDLVLAAGYQRDYIDEHPDEVDTLFHKHYDYYEQYYNALNQSPLGSQGSNPVTQTSNNVQGNIISQGSYYTVETDADGGFIILWTNPSRTPSTPRRSKYKVTSAGGFLYISYESGSPFLLTDLQMLELGATKDDLFGEDDYDERYEPLIEAARNEDVLESRRIYEQRKLEALARIPELEREIAELESNGRDATSKKNELKELRKDTLPFKTELERVLERKELDIRARAEATLESKLMKVTIRPNGEVYVETPSEGLDGTLARNIAQRLFATLFTQTPAATAASSLQTANRTAQQLILDAKNMILASLQVVLPASARDPNADSYIINGERYMRVHGAMGSSWIGRPSRNGERSRKFGRIVDSIVRDYFNGLPVTKPLEFSDDAFNYLISSLDSIKAKMLERGEEFLANNIVLYHEFPNGLKVAGEVDIIGVRVEDGKVKYNIYDLKTSAGDRNGAAFTESAFWETSTSKTRNSVRGNKDEYTLQQSLYKLLFERMFDSSISNLALLPYKLNFDLDNNVISIQKYPGIPITYSKDAEKVVAYQPLVESSLSALNHAYQGRFSLENLQTLKGIILANVVNGKSINDDLNNWLNNNPDIVTILNLNPNAVNQILEDLFKSIQDLDVEQTLKETEILEEQEAPDPIIDNITDSSLQGVEASPVSDQVPPIPAANTPEGYSPTAETIEQPPIGSEFGLLGDTSSTTIPLSSSNQVQQGEDTDLVTNRLEDIDINGQTVGNISPTIKGNAMSPYVYQDALGGILAHKLDQTRMQLYNAWMDSRGIHTLELIDNKLIDILNTGTEHNPVKVLFLVVNHYNQTLNDAVHNDYMRGHYLLAVEYTPAIEAVYGKKDLDRYGKPVKANGKEYIIIGTAGYAIDAQKEAYNDIVSRGTNSVREKAQRYFSSNKNEEFFVDLDRYTHVARIHSGFLIKRLADDSSIQYRPLSELLEGPEKDKRNPHNLKWSDLVFGYLRLNDFKTVPASDETIYRSPAKGALNLGNVFVYVRGANGIYTPAMIRPTRYGELRESSLKNKIQEAINKLSDDSHAKRYEGLLELQSMLVVNQKDTSGVPIGIEILIGLETIPTLTIKNKGVTVYHSQTKNIVMLELLNVFGLLNPRVSITKSKLLSISDLKELDEAGALMTDLAILGKAAGDFSIYNIGADGKPIIPSQRTYSTYDSSSIVRGDSTRFNVNHLYYTRDGNSFKDDAGNPVTDAALLNHILMNEYVLNKGLSPVYTENNTEYYVDGVAPAYEVFTRNSSTHEMLKLTGTEAAVVIQKMEQLASLLAAKSAALSRDLAALLALQQLLEEERLRREQEEALRRLREEEELARLAQGVNTKNSVLDLLDDNGWKSSQPKLPSTPNPATATAPNVVLDVNITTGTSIKDMENSRKVGNFADGREWSALEILLLEGEDEHFSDEAVALINAKFPETASMSTWEEMIDVLNRNGKVTTGIKDIQAWIDTIKC